MLTAANPNELLNEEQTAKLIGVAEQTLAGWRCNGRYGLPFVKVGRLVRYKRGDVMKWLDKRTVQAGTAD
jgi:excisionase family DNA binding protein